MVPANAVNLLAGDSDPANLIRTQRGSDSTTAERGRLTAKLDRLQEEYLEGRLGILPRKTSRDLQATRDRPD